MNRNEKKKRILFLWGVMLFAMALFMGCGTETGKEPEQVITEDEPEEKSCVENTEDELTTEDTVVQESTASVLVDDSGTSGKINMQPTIVSGEAVEIPAHIKEISGQEILISSDADAFPGVFSVEVPETVSIVSELSEGGFIRILMQNLEEEISGIPKYLANDILPLDEPEEPLRADYDLMLTSPPVINLSDPLSSTWESFEVLPGNYSWNYGSGGEMTGVIACGTHPLDAAARIAKLELPKYQRMDTILYSIGMDVGPDRFIVRKWDADDVGNTQARELSVITIYEPTLLLHLETDKIYELTAIWEKEKADMRGFYGDAGYMFATE